jgi:hypothetical protein
MALQIPAPSGRLALNPVRHTFAAPIPKPEESPMLHFDSAGSPDVSFEHDRRSGRGLWRRLAAPVLMGAAGGMCATAAFAQGGPQPTWAAQFGSGAEEIVRGVAPFIQFAPFSPMDAYVAGSTRGNLAAPNQGGLDAFLVRYDDAGNQVWARQFGGTGDEFIWTVASDLDGGAVLAGYTESDLAGFNGWRDAFAARYDASGTQLWVRQFGTVRSDIARDIILWRDPATAQSGLYITGNTAGDLAGPNAGSNDVFLAALHPGTGSTLWSRQFGSDLSELGRGLALDTTTQPPGVYIVGDTYGALPGGGGSAGGLDIFLTRFDSAGNQLWTRQFGSSAADFGFAIAEDGVGGVFVAGATAGDLAAPNAGSYDAWIARYDSSGNRLWIHQFGTPQWDEVFTLTSDGAGGVYAAGGTEGSLGRPNPGASDAFIARFDHSGAMQWLTQFGTGSPDGAVSLARRPAGGAFVAGYTDGALGGPGSGSRDGFVARFDREACYANCDHSTTPPILNVEDFTCFIQQFSAAHSLPEFLQIAHYANCDNSTTSPVLNVEDFTCFISKFASGCP